MHFSAAAVNWDDERRVKRAKTIADEILNVIPIKDTYTALDFGCGTGLVSFNLYDRFEHITLVDTSAGMIDVLKQKIQNFGITNMTAFLIDSNGGLEFDGKYDVIYTSMVLHHIKDVGDALKGLYKLLKNDGCLCIVDLVEDDGSFHKSEKDFDGHNGFNQGELKGLLEDAGLKNIKSKVFYRDYKIIDDSQTQYSLFIMTGVKQR